MDRIIKISLGLFFFGSVVFCLGGCATRDIYVDEHNNPPPKYKFSDFSKFELKDVTIAPKYSAHPANKKAHRKIQENFNNKLGIILEAWNQSQISSSKGTLVIAPEIVQIKFIGGGARFWVGALAGSSAVNMVVVYTEKETGEVVDRPNFYQHANAVVGGWSIGVTDNNMLDRIVDLIANYTVSNYKEAIGGVTGKPE